MSHKTNWQIKSTTTKDDRFIAQHFYQLWLDNDFSAEQLQDNWLEITLDFIAKARQELSFQAWLVETEGKIIGSASCQLFSGLYPLVFKPEFRRYGYIWNVYVESDFRRQGIATALMKRCVDYLKSTDCTRIILHASVSGKPVYENMDFISSNEMRLDILD